MNVIEEKAPQFEETIKFKNNELNSKENVFDLKLISERFLFENPEMFFENNQ